MTAARSEMLERIRGALLDRPTTAPVPRDYRLAESGVGDVDLFCERVSDYRARVLRCSQDAIASQVRACLKASDGVVLCPRDLPEEWVEGVDTQRDEDLPLRSLDAAGAVVTGARLAIAETGTVVLDHGTSQGRRALTLLPDHHVVIVRSAQMVRGVPEAIAALDPRRPLTWISGPSATSDIELDRVEGVHGPRRLDVIVVLP